MESIKISLYELLNKYNKIIIPDIQRDYVMGSGEENLKSLFKAMEKACHNNQEFNFSCIMGHKDENEDFYVYDGQQRLATLLYLCAYKYNNSNSNNDIVDIDLLSNFSFTGREEANLYLKKLISRQNECKLEVVDFTTFSINNLIKEFQAQDYFREYYERTAYENLIDISFLYTKVKFELVNVDKAEDAEQFFMDLNDGLKLEEYEIFKAQLNHRAYELLGQDFKELALLLDNQWLNFFLKYSNKDICEEETEIKFIQFCFRMMFIEDNNSDTEYDENNIEWIEEKHIRRLQSILTNIMDLDIDNENSCNCINYSFGEYTDEELIQNVTGVYWKLDNYDYNSMLKEFILNINRKDQIKNDVLIWCYICNIGDTEKKYLFSYLRFIKKLLNNNRIENNKICYTEEGKLWFSKYSTYGIPDYYKHGKSIKFEGDCEKYEKYLIAIIKVNLYFNNNKNFEPLNLLKLCEDNNRLINVLITEDYKCKSRDYKAIEKIENLPYFNGLIDNILDEYKNLIISYDTIKTRLKVFKQSNLEYRKAINQMYNELSYYIDSFDPIIEKNLLVSWKAYTGNESWLSYKVKLVPQCLNDIFTDTRLIDVIKKWIYRKDRLTNQCNEVQFYLRNYGLILKQGWIEENMQVSYPKNYYAINNYGYRRRNSSGLFSINSRSCNPLKKFKNIKENFEEHCYSFTLDINNKLQFKLNNKNISKDNITNIITESNLNFIERQLIDKKYKEIFFYNDKICNNIILKKYIEEDSSNINTIKLWKNSGGIFPILNKCYFLTDDSLKNFIKTIKVNRVRLKK
ncbi:DUF262 domain-containing protein [Clostridium butyricum]|uniref:GmrSD restriction endonucleases N-terminal domain-containing protein n=1 Tax=Clostridium butyricum TaxID=1492 RepID=A0A2S7FEY8_CLOBU|nr:DUF262 domain-containing protein [Clostridium butyricum]KHD14003.1 hypothetical protein OA81_17930 [Clostridium butyricum]PPV17734.1 hypothetical protein AWN73_06945 [Clostridium butyricum]